MKWFEEDVLPCIDLYSHDKRYTFIHINGEQEVNEVHNAIVSSLEKSIVQ